jgi:hypothetical protein
VQTVLAMRAMRDPKSGDIEGVTTLHKNEIKRTIRGKTDVLETLKTEDERVRAIEKYFDIVLRDEERKAILGRPTELKG